MHQETLRTPVEFSGIGLHTGEHATVRILPAPADKGIVFRRVDLDNFELLADVASVARVANARTLWGRGVGFRQSNIFFRRCTVSESTMPISNWTTLKSRFSTEVRSPMRKRSLVLAYSRNGPCGDISGLRSLSCSGRARKRWASTPPIPLALSMTSIFHTLLSESRASKFN